MLKAKSSSFYILLALYTGASESQTITVTGSNALISNGCALPEIPTACPGEILTDFPPGTVVSPWSLPTNFANGLAVGTNKTNTDTGPAASGAVSVNGGASVEGAYVYAGYEKIQRVR